MEIEVYKLYITLLLRENPYAYDPSAKYDAWGEVTVEVANASSVRFIFSTQWDLAQLAEWFIENIGAICNQKLDVLLPIMDTTTSISAAIAKFMADDELDVFDDKVTDMYELLNTYSFTHDLYYGIDGSRWANHIYIGCNKGFGEISWYYPETKGVYYFDMMEFIRDFKKEIYRFINEWIKLSRSPEADKRGGEILAGLAGLDVSGCCKE
jgi:hypothetical protein